MITGLMVLDGLRNGPASRRWVVLLGLLGVVVCCAGLPAVSLAASEPSIGAPSAEVGGNEATLKAPIRPEGLETRYEVWLQCTSASCASSEGHRVADGSIEAARLEEEIDVPLMSLEWNASYSFEVIATNKDGTVSSDPQTFATGTPPPAGCPDGCGSKPAEFKAESWNNEGASREGNEAPRLEEEREAKAKEEAERPAKEASARAAHEREVREAGERAGREAAERERLAKENSARQAAAAMCRVPSLEGDSLAVARRALGKAHCRLGKVSKPRGHHHQRLVVTGQSAKSGRTLTGGATVAVKLGPAGKTRGG